MNTPTMTEPEKPAHKPSDPPLIDVYKNAQSPEPYGSVTLEDFHDAIVKGEYKEDVAKLREMLSNGDKDGYAKAKRNLECVSLSGTCDGRRAKAVEETRFTHSGYMQVDFDAADNIGWDVADIREILRAEPRICQSFVTPSGDGVKGVALVPRDPATHAACFVAIREHFARHNLVVDEACKDPVRLCFVSHDPQAWLDLTRTEMFLPALTPSQQPQEIGEDNRPSAGLVLRLRDEAFPLPPESGIHQWLMISAWWCRIHDMTSDDTIAKLQAYDGSLRRRYQPNEVQHAVDKVFSAKRDSDWRVEQDVAAILNPPAGSTLTEYHPDDIFFDQPAGKYLIRVNNAYHLHGKQSPVVTGLTRYLAKEITDPKQLAATVRATLKDRELDGGVQWSGRIAGHQQGMTEDIDGLPMLITSEAIQPQPSEGSYPIIEKLLEQAFPDATPYEVFVAWLAGRYKAVRSHIHVPAPMLVMAGAVNSGKSLLAWIAGQLLGGRIVNPYSAWTGGMLWNDDLIGSELLLVDDCAGSTDIRARRNFAAAFKEANYPPIVQLRKRHASSVSVRPVWSVILCCNDTPEALNVIPPIDDDLDDKIIMLHVNKVDTPIDTSTPAGRAQFQAMLRAELPALAHDLLQYETPAHLKDTRSGIIAWRDPDLMGDADSNSPARRLEALLETAIEQDNGTWGDLPRTFHAMEIESRLMDYNSPVSQQARGLFCWHGAGGAYMARLCKIGCRFVSRAECLPGDKKARFHIGIP